MSRLNAEARLERNVQIIELYQNGSTTSEISTLVGVRQPQVWRILKDNKVTIRPQKADLLGKRFGSWLVVSESAGIGGHAQWLCRCDCGTERVTAATFLVMGRSKSCGCSKNDRIRTARTTHNRSSSVEYRMYAHAKKRAQEQCIPFTITLDDIIIPEFCPVLGVRLECNTGSAGWNSPSLDKLIPSLGYVKGNINVISQRANTLKSDAHAKELRAVADWLEREVNCG